MNILDIIGKTPLLELSNISKENAGIKLFAKAEFLNPSGSIKDRAAKAMILDGVKRGLLTKDKTIIDATSGNTGIAYAMLGAVLGFNVTLYMPQNASVERKRIIKSFGAKVVETDPLESSDGAFLRAKEAYENNPQIYFYPNQYNNPINPQTHYENTGVEILTQTENKITHFIAGAGTSGTFMGVSRRLKEFNPSIKTILVQPNSPFHGIEGTKHLASTIKPSIFNDTYIDDTITVSTEEAYAMARSLAAKEGIFTGISSGANIAAALKLAKTLPKGSLIVSVLCDSGSRYLSDSFWDKPL
ncbi:MAG: cysteine synthase family protein [Elusimicrobiota bacterium]|jgi:cysteine synthase B|nr:cysteine synthase family protein [Elusimicrobiota bacterium]